ncbi:MAG TPA: hypothetical protein VNH18_12810, partial [Bryobacteraceae bacterium]|nr:hypothetical protein [Bryobacteraceae bacterium]
ITPRYMEKFPEGAVVRVSTTLSEAASAIESTEHAALTHIGSGIVRQWFARPEAAARWLAASGARGWKGVIECAGENAKASLDLWPSCGGDFAIMKQIKNMFDPEGLLNIGRLFGRI